MRRGQGHATEGERHLEGERKLEGEAIVLFWESVLVVVPYNLDTRRINASTSQ